MLPLSEAPRQEAPTKMSGMRPARCGASGDDAEGLRGDQTAVATEGERPDLGTVCCETIQDSTGRRVPQFDHPALSG